MTQSTLSEQLLLVREYAKFSGLYLAEDLLSALLCDIPNRADWIQVYRYRTGASANEASAEYRRRFSLNKKIVV